MRQKIWARFEQPHSDQPPTTRGTSADAVRSAAGGLSAKTLPDVVLASAPKTGLTLLLLGESASGTVHFSIVLCIPTYGTFLFVTCAYQRVLSATVAQTLSLVNHACQRQESATF